MISPIMCYLKDEEEYVKMYGNKIAGNQNACRNSKDFYHNVIPALNNDKSDNWTFFSLSRHPIERFISGFSNICIDILAMENRALCYNCGNNMECFIKSLYKDILNYSINKNDVENYFIAAHFFPQNWMCDYFQFFNKYKIIHYSSHKNEKRQFLNNLKKLFQEVNIPNESQRFVLEKLNETSTVHSTINKDSHNLAMKMLYDSPKLLNILNQIFYYDFILFNYSITDPSFISLPKVQKLYEYRY
uniref:Sulfotransferase family protein n=1 Tax=Parastrongyloides trichosuri TaxID=131310 RepID=A0A0N4ZSE7_PARTI